MNQWRTTRSKWRKLSCEQYTLWFGENFNFLSWRKPWSNYNDIFTSVLRQNMFIQAYISNLIRIYKLKSTLTSTNSFSRKKCINLYFKSFLQWCTRNDEIAYRFFVILISESCRFSVHTGLFSLKIFLNLGLYITNKVNLAVQLSLFHLNRSRKWL